MTYLKSARSALQVQKEETSWYEKQEKLPLEPLYTWYRRGKQYFVAVEQRQPFSDNDSAHGFLPNNASAA